MSNPIHLDLSRFLAAAANDESMELLMRLIGATGTVLSPKVASLGLNVPLAGLAISFDLRHAPDVNDLHALLKPHASPSLLLLVTLTSSDAHDKAGTPRAMPAAAACITPVAEAARTLGMNITLSPRLGTWLEHPQDAVRLAMRVNKRHVGVALDCNAWEQTDGRDEALPDVLRLMLPKLNALTLSPAGALASWRDDETYKKIAPRLTAQGWHGPVVVRPAGA